MSAGRDPDAPSPVGGCSRRPLTLLVVDDHPAVRALIRTIAASFAAQIHECANGAEAIAAYVAHRPDVVLMDIVMPDLDGLAATRRICAVDPSAFVVIVTDYDGPELREQAEGAGARRWVVKERLLEIRQVLEDAGALKRR